MAESVHRTVLLKESIDALNLTSGAIVVDATINGGGHSEEMAKRYGASVRIVGIDLDQDALDRSRARLEAIGANVSLYQSSFRNLDAVLAQAGVEIGKVNGILFDLGWSSDQFEVSGRGFSFQKDEPLLMTFAKDDNGNAAGAHRITAYQIVNEWDEQNIADIIYGYGEERYSRRIAKKIVEARAVKRIETTFELVEVIKSAVPYAYQKGKTNCATKTFQALRITVNDELQALREGLAKGFTALAPKGRMAVISFHSTEDRIVKRFFQEKAKAGEDIDGNTTKAEAVIITKKPIEASDEELELNRRSRSAKLRILEKK